MPGPMPIARLFRSSRRGLPPVPPRRDPELALERLRERVLRGVPHPLRHRAQRRVGLAQQATGRGHAEWTIPRPNWFLQNFGESFAATLRERGVLELPAGEAALSFADTRDIAAVAAAAFAEDGHAGRVYDVTGPQSLTYREALAIIGDVVGRALTYRPITHEQSAANLRAAGAPERSIIWQRGLYDLVQEGANAPVSDVVERVTGRPARALARYAAENVDLWR